MIAGLLFILFIACAVLQGFYATYFFIFIWGKPRHAPGPETVLPVSVIICAKNEAENLERNLEAVLAQDYRNEEGQKAFEVIVVDDASTDSSSRILESLQQQHSHLKIIRIEQEEPRTFPGKKFALNRGVEAATYDHLIMTDADCLPASPYWIRHLAQPFLSEKEQTQIVGGYGSYSEAPGLLNAFIRWETLHSFLQYATYAARKLPYMVVGRNMACHRSAFLHARQSPVWSALPSGDDDLLVRLNAATGKGVCNVKIVANAESFTISVPEHTWRGWMAQKQRHLSTGKYYAPAIKLLLGMYALSHAGIWLLAFALSFTRWWPYAACIFGARCLLYWTLWAGTAHRLGERRLTPLFPLLDIGWLLYNLIFSPYILWKTKQRWS